MNNFAKLLNELNSDLELYKTQKIKCELKLKSLNEKHQNIEDTIVTKKLNLANEEEDMLFTLKKYNELEKPLKKRHFKRYIEFTIILNALYIFAFSTGLFSLINLLAQVLTNIIIYFFIYFLPAKCQTYSCAFLKNTYTIESVTKNIQNIKQELQKCLTEKNKLENEITTQNTILYELEKNIVEMEKILNYVIEEREKALNELEPTINEIFAKNPSLSLIKKEGITHE